MILETECPHCSHGMIYDPAWKAWHERNHYPYGPDTDPEPPGPEEYACPDCEGSGRTLTEDGKFVAALIQRLITSQLDYALREAKRKP